MLENFLKNVKAPVAIVGQLRSWDRMQVINFLRKINIPVYLEAPSGIRECPELQNQRIFQLNKLTDFPVDGVLRIGGVPTTRIWRDLEEMEGGIAVCSLSHLPFSGLSWGNVCSIELLREFRSCSDLQYELPKEWFMKDSVKQKLLNEIIDKEPQAEPSLIRALSEQIPDGSMIYLGNSLPIRHWDLAATNRPKNFTIEVNRGVNGIDGQISTFLGLCEKGRENWAIIGDLTALYDMAGPWIIKQMESIKIRIVVINNSGGKIFANIFPQKSFQNPHDLTFRPLAEMWGVPYQRWERVDDRACESLLREETITGKNCTLIEVVPDSEATRSCKCFI